MADGANTGRLGERLRQGVSREMSERERENMFWTDLTYCKLIDFLFIFFNQCKKSLGHERLVLSGPGSESPVGWGTRIPAGQ